MITQKHLISNKHSYTHISRVVLRLKHRLITILLSDRSKKQEAYLITTLMQGLAAIKEIREKKNILETNRTIIDLDEVFRIAHSCCSRPSLSRSGQRSMNLPSAMRKISIEVTVTCLPVGGMLPVGPLSSPLCVPRTTQRATTLSPSAITSSTLTRTSGKV